MTWRGQRSFLLSFLIGLALAAVVPFTASAEEEDETPSAPAEPADSKDAPDDPFAVPDTDDAEKLLAFIEDIRARRPRGYSNVNEYREYRRYQLLAQPAVLAAAEKVMKVEKDKKSDSYRRAVAYLMEDKIRTVPRANAEERKQILADVVKQFKQTGMGQTEASLAYGLANLLEKADDPSAGKAYRELGELVEKSDDDSIRQLAPLFVGPARRLSLLGSKMKELPGTTLAGDDFDWAKYRGKIVLVDFWATWCPGCLAEIPNLKAAYEKYHDQGFEVVGVNLDERREAVESFLRRSKLPWVQLFEEGSASPAAQYYGVSGIPFMVLVGRDGTVISTTARGRELDRELEKLFPEKAGE